MIREEKERLIKKDIASIENIVRHAFNQGYEFGLKERKNTCEDAVSRQAVLDEISDYNNDLDYTTDALYDMVKRMSPVTPLPKMGHCKECKYFENDGVAKFDGIIPLMAAHEICSRWGNGCKTKEDGYCFLFEPQEGEDKE